MKATYDAKSDTLTLKSSTHRIGWPKPGPCNFR